MTGVSLVSLGFVAIGAVAGFAFHRLVGCRSGACVIWANPYAATGYGALLGLLLGAGR
ncbi:MAG: hypothetical protein JNL83_09250 [Myxococcales bacterium]|nr:hypothetical protein [Myxococcales bacterium]